MHYTLSMGQYALFTDHDSKVLQNEVWDAKYGLSYPTGTMI